ncbi:hypothetical protein [Methyloglobulus sp.]
MAQAKQNTTTRRLGWSKAETQQAYVSPNAGFRASTQPTELLKNKAR